LREVLGFLAGARKSPVHRYQQACLIQFGHDHVVSQVLEVTRPWRSQCVLISSDLAAIHRARRLGDAPIGWD